MKLILSGKVPPQPFSEQGNQISLPILKVNSNPAPIMINKIVQHQSILGQNVHTAVQSQVRQTLFEKMKCATQALTGRPSNLGSSRLKRRGRPPKAGPSKMIKKPKVSSMYLGKLSNVVPFRRRWESESESDVESVVLFY